MPMWRRRQSFRFILVTTIVFATNPCWDTLLLTLASNQCYQPLLRQFDTNPYYQPLIPTLATTITSRRTMIVILLVLKQNFWTVFIVRSKFSAPSGVCPVPLGPIKLGLVHVHCKCSNFSIYCWNPLKGVCSLFLRPCRRWKGFWTAKDFLGSQLISLLGFSSLIITNFFCSSYFPRL